MNVLIVEDCQVMQVVIKRAMEISDLKPEHIFTAGNGREGIEILQREEMDLVILDMNMPVMDGMKMLEMLRSDPETENVPVLVVSTESNEQRVEAMTKLGVKYIHKPFTPEFLISEMETLTGHKFVAGKTKTEKNGIST